MLKQRVEAYSQQIADNLFDPLLIFDSKGYIVYVNKSFVNFLGYSLEELKGRPVSRIFPREGKEKLNEVIKKINQQGVAIRDFSLQVLTKNKKNIPVNFSGWVLRNQEGKTIGGFGTFNDVRQLKGLLDSLSQAKSELEQRVKERTRELSEAKTYIEVVMGCIAEPLFTFDKKGYVTYVNSAFEELLGWKKEEIVGLSLEEYHKKMLPPEWRTLLTQRVKKRLETGETVRGVETTVLKKSGEEIPIIYAATGIKDVKGNIIGEVVVLTDITELKKARQAAVEVEREKRALAEKTAKELEDSQKALMNILTDVDEVRGETEEERNKIQTIITNLADGLLVFDEKDNLVLINPQAEKFFNIRAKEVIGKPLRDLNVFPSLKPLIGLLVEEIKGIFRKELVVRERLNLEVSTTPIMREKERAGILVIVHDITREKMIERMKTEFVSLAAHQLRTPLSAIKWTLRMLLDGDLGEITAAQRDFVEKTYRSNERMINLINDLLNVTRIEEGRYLFQLQFSQLEDVVQFVINSSKEEIEKRKIKFEFKRPEKKLPKVRLDVEKIRLAIQNLFDNAIRYTPPGGTVTISLRYVRKEVEFQIKDSGVGIPKDQQARVFSKFFRATNVMRMETEGSGLGLYIAKNVIQAHQGRIWFESEEGKGTAFYFALPIREEFAEFLKKL